MSLVSGIRSGLTRGILSGINPHAEVEEEESNTHSLQLTRTSTQYVYYNDASAVLTGGEMVIECYLLFDSLPVGSAIWSIFTKFASGNETLLVRLRENGANKEFQALISEDGSSSARSFVSWAWNPSVDTAVKLELTWDGSQTGAENEWSLAIDDVDQGSPTVIADDSISTMHSQTRNFEIGAREGANTFDGRFDEFKYYGDLAKSDLRLHYKFNNNLTDDSGNNRDATGANSPTFGDPLT